MLPSRLRLGGKHVIVEIDDFKFESVKFLSKATGMRLKEVAADFFPREPGS